MRAGCSAEPKPTRAEATGLRVRHHEHTARLEVPVADMPRLLAPGVREAVVQELKRLGFAYVALDLQGFRSGSLNETLAAPETRRAGG